LNRYNNEPGSLIAVLQETQEIMGFLPIAILREIAGRMNIPGCRVYGVATFYAQFRFQPIGKNLILLCKGTACHVNGAEHIETSLCSELELEMGQTSADGLFTLSSAACLGCCSLAPVMVINGQAYGPLTPDRARAVVREMRSRETKSAKGGDSYAN